MDGNGFIHIKEDTIWWYVFACCHCSQFTTKHTSLTSLSGLLASTSHSCCLMNCSVIRLLTECSVNAAVKMRRYGVKVLGKQSSVKTDLINRCITVNWTNENTLTQAASVRHFLLYHFWMCSYLKGSGGSVQSRTPPPWVVPVPRDQWRAGAPSVGGGHFSAAEEGWHVHYFPLVPRPVPPAVPAWDGDVEKLDSQQVAPNHHVLNYSTSPRGAIVLMMYYKKIYVCISR